MSRKNRNNAFLDVCQDIFYSQYNSIYCNLYQQQIHKENTARLQRAQKFKVRNAETYFSQAQVQVPATS